MNRPRAVLLAYWQEVINMEINSLFLDAIYLLTDEQIESTIEAQP